MENTEFEVQLNNYDGPLELLLTLVKAKKMDIFSINLEELATAYLDLINNLNGSDLDLASEYLVMAATLLHIKGKSLLEDPDSKKEVETTKEHLIQRLAEYQQFKLVGEQLKDNEFHRKQLFTKDNEDYKQYERAIDETKLDGSSDAVKLIMALRKMFERTNAQALRSGTISQVNISPEDRQEEIREMLIDRDELSFEEVFTVPTMAHFVITMLAILDMSRLQEIHIEQEEQYGDITIIKGGKDE